MIILRDLPGSESLKEFYRIIMTQYIESLQHWVLRPTEFLPSANSGRCQQLDQPLPGRAGCGGPVRCMTDDLSIYKPPELTHCDDLVLTVTSGNGITKLLMRPQAIIVYGYDISDQQLLPFQSLSPCLAVQLYRFKSFGRSVRKYYGLCGCLTSLS